MTEATTAKIHWNGGVQGEAIDILKEDGGMIVSPTKVAVSYTHLTLPTN